MLLGLIFWDEFNGPKTWPIRVECWMFDLLWSDLTSSSTWAWHGRLRTFLRRVPPLGIPMKICSKNCVFLPQLCLLLFLACWCCRLRPWIFRSRGNSNFIFTRRFGSRACGNPAFHFFAFMDLLRSDPASFLDCLCAETSSRKWNLPSQSQTVECFNPPAWPTVNCWLWPLSDSAILRQW